MRKTLTRLGATTMLTAVIALPVWSATHRPATDPSPFAAVLQERAQATPVIRVSGIRDDDHKYNRTRKGTGRGHDDDDDDTCNDDYDDDDDDDDDNDDDATCADKTRSPAPAGTVAPPQNGLFGNGAPPKVKMN